MNAITPSIVTSRRSMTVEIGEAIAEFSPEETRISLGKNAVGIPRQVWLQVVAESPVYDNALGGVLASAPLSVPAAPRVITAHELGSEIGGGFCAGRHPTEEGRTLIVSGFDGDFAADDDDWQAINSRCQEYGAEGDWRAPTRQEALQLFELFAPGLTKIPGFRKGEKHAFREEAYWTNQEYTFYSGYAWLQHFGNGNSYYWYEYTQLRGRAVRIL